jgi:N-acetylglucosaminyldiphosphoundecaprenol N-acetyl-beta-D-mannosaminyltransferase
MMGEIRCSTHSIEQLVEEVRHLLAHRAEQPRNLLCLNAHIFNLAYKDHLLRDALRRARVVTADGMSIVWGSHLFKTPVPNRCNMTEAFAHYLQTADMPDARAVLVGLEPAEAEIAARAMEARSGHLSIVEVCSGYLTEDEYRAYFARLEGIDLILVGMGTPRTEIVCAIATQARPECVVWGIGAGTIRIFSGTMREAPVILRRIGLQWLHRLCCEPAHLWRRYLIGNPLFLYRMFKLSLRAEQPGPRESSVYRSGIES